MPLAPSLSRRLFLIGAASTVAGCDATGPAWSAFAGTLSIATGTAGGATMTREQIDASPYALLAARIGRGPQGILVLSAAESGSYTWVSADRVAITTSSGRIVKTAGLPKNLRGTRSLDPDPLAQGLHRLDGLRRHVRLIDLEATGLYGVRAVSTFTPEGPDVLTIAGQAVPVLAVREDVVLPRLDETLEQRHWVDPETGAVVASDQYYDPTLPPLRYQMLKRPTV